MQSEEIPDAQDSRQTYATLQAAVSASRYATHAGGRSMRGGVNNLSLIYFESSKSVIVSGVGVRLLAPC